MSLEGQLLFTRGLKYELLSVNLVTVISYVLSETDLKGNKT